MVVKVAFAVAIANLLFVSSYYHFNYCFLLSLFVSFPTTFAFEIKNPFVVSEHLSLPKAIVDPKYIHNPIPNMRAWRCHGRSNREMVEKLTAAQIIKTKAVQEALLKVDRGNYVINRESAYADTPQSIGFGQTISAPHMHAHVLEELLPTLVQLQHQRQTIQNSNYPHPNNYHPSATSTAAASTTTTTHSHELRILDVGCGSGYLSSCLGRLVHEHENSLGLKGKVFGIELLNKLVEFSKFNAQKEDDDLIRKGIVSFQKGDGWKGLPSEAPFDVIHVGAAAADFPKELMMQLSVGGRMICPVGPEGEIQYLYRIDRLQQSDDNGGSGSAQFQPSDFVFQELLGVRYVPLVRN